MGLAGSAFADSFEEYCEKNLKPTQIVVRTDISPSSKNNELSYTDLSKMRQHGSHGLANTFGLTHAKVHTTTQYNYHLLKHPSGRSCMRPSVEMQMAYTPITLYVGREFPVGSCEHQFILSHEMRHEKVYVDYLKLASTLFTEEIKTFFANKIFYGDSAQALDKSLKESVEGYWQPRAQAWLDNIDKVQMSVDTPEEYSRVDTACNGGIPKIVKAAAQARRSR